LEGKGLFAQNKKLFALAKQILITTNKSTPIL
jgi:hypothetical protein